MRIKLKLSNLYSIVEKELIEDLERCIKRNPLKSIKIQINGRKFKVHFTQNDFTIKTLPYGHQYKEVDIGLEG